MERKEKKVNAANQVKDQATTRARRSYENKSKDPNFVDPLMDGNMNLIAVFDANGEVHFEVDAFRRKGK